MIVVPSSHRGHEVRVSVKAYTGNANISLVAHFENSVDLLDGVPQAGHGIAGKTDYYRFNAGSETQTAIFAYANTHGRSTMYISKTGQPDRHTPSTYEWKSWSWFHAPHTIRRGTTAWPDNDIFYIGMYSLTNSSYALLARSDDRTHALLRDGVQVTARVSNQGYQYFKYQVDNPGCNVTIQVTPYSGDPDLFVSSTAPYPNSTAATWRSTRFGVSADSVYIPRAPVGHYYIGVRGFRNSTFGIYGHSRCDNTNLTRPVDLLDGTPTRGYLARGRTALYKFYNSHAHEELSFSVSAESGDPDLFISRSRFTDPAAAELSQSGYGSDFVSIKPTDSQFCTNCAYYVLIRAASDTQYSLLVSTGDAIVTLSDGVSFEEDLEAHHAEYFLVNVDAEGADLSIVLTDFGQGDPDMYVSTVNRHPNAGNFTWRANSYGADAITIAADDPKACGQCIYYIGVVAFTHSHMSIIATWGEPSRLRDGEPQAGFVAKHQMKYYKMVVYGGHSDLSIRATTTAGLMTMYVSTTGEPKRADSNSYDRMVPFRVSAKSVVLREGDNTNCTMAASQTMCQYWIGVYGDSAANFSIVASTNHVTTRLQNGVTVQDHIDAHTYEYFSIRVANPGQALTIAVTPLSGDPDLYVSLAHEFPRRGMNATRESRNLAGDTVVYDPAPAGLYHIGVLGYRATTFTVNALIHSRNGTTQDEVLLTDGQPQSAVNRAASWSYFTFNLPQATSELTISVTRVYGDPDLYVGFGRRPNRTSFAYHSIRYGNDFIAIRDPAVGRYRLGVFAFSAASFTILAKTENTSTVLQDSVPVHDALNPRQSTTYTFNHDDLGRDVTFVLTPMTGDPDLFVSLGNHTWQSRYWLEDSITIPHDDPNFCTSARDCSFSVRVYAYTATRFTLTASTQNTTQLANGVPQAGSCHRNQFQYYRFECKPQSQVTLTATPVRGFLRMYVSKGSTDPTTSRYDYRSRVSYSVNTLRFVAGEHGSCGTAADSNCVYVIGVLGTTRVLRSTAPATTRFSVLARTSEYAAVLQHGVPVHGWAERRTELFYRFDVPRAGSELLVSITAITGDPDVYISWQTTRPGPAFSDIKSRNWGSDTIIIQNANATSYYIGVYAFTNSTYTISASVVGNGTHVRQNLINGQPQHGTVAGGQHRYYSLSLASATTMLTFSLTTTVGDPDLNVTLVSTGRVWTASKWGNDVIVIHDAPAGEYSIDVIGFRDTEYTLVVAEGGVATALLDGVPMRDRVQRQQYDYFKMYVDRTNMDLTITVTAFNGDPDLFVSDTVQHPTRQNANYSARYFREDSITISSARLRRGYYYISVYGAGGNSTFSILATFSNQTMLVDGIPQAGQLATEAARYYTFRAPRSHARLTFSLTRYRGAGDMYISTTGPPEWRNRATYQWRSSFWNRNSISIQPSDPDYRIGGLYYVMVQSYRNCSYSLTASTGIGVTQLQSGVQQLQSTDQGEMIMFSFALANSRSDLEIAVTPLSGSVELHVSTKSATGPWQWSAVAMRSTLLDIAYGDANYTVGTYYIGVKGITNATFTITASVYDLSQNGTVLLNDGVPQLGLVKRGKDRYYQFPVDTYTDVTLSVTPRYGDPDLFVTMDGSTPTPWHYSYKARRYGGDEIVIPRSQVCHHCTLRIAAHLGSGAKCLYSITATTNGKATILEAGQTLSATVQAREYREFVFFMTEAADLVVDVMPISDGDPDVYVAHYPSPNRTRYEYRSNRWGRDSLLIPHASARYYYISVYGFRTSSFRITANIASEPVTLVEGQVQSSFVQKGHTRNYVFHFHDQGRQSITLALHQFDGNAVMYVSTTTPNPSAANHYWSTASAQTGSQRGLLTLRPTDAHFCHNCTFYVAVVGVEASTFSLLGSVASGSSLMVYSQPMPVSLDSGERRKFRFLVDDNTTDVSLQVTLFSGEVNVYVAHSSVTTEPSAATHQFATVVTEAQQQAIDIPHTLAGRQLGVYYLSVVAARPSQATLTATADNVMLQSGVPSSGHLSADGSLFLYHTDATKDIEVTVEPASVTDNTAFEVYASINTTHPSAQHHDFYARVERGKQFRIPLTERRACKQLFANTESCIIYFAVYPYSPSDAGKAFTMTASAPDTIKQLTNHRPMDGAVNTTVAGRAGGDFEGWLYYETFVSRETDVFTLTLEPCIGESDLYIDTQSFKPSLQHYLAKSTRSDEVDRITFRDPNYFDSSFYAGVRSHAASSRMLSYRIYGDMFSPGQQPSPSASLPDPKLQVSFSGSSARISWARPQEAAGLPTTGYNVYWMDKATQSMPNKPIPYTACGLDAGRRMGVVQSEYVRPTPSADNARETFEVSGLSADGEYIVNVVAVVEAQGGDTQELVYKYEEASASSNYDGGGSGDAKGAAAMGWTLGIGLPVMIGCVLAIFCLWRKNRKLTQELEIEMGDVPKRASRVGLTDFDDEIGDMKGGSSVITGSGRARREKYSSLLGETDDGDELDGDHFESEVDPSEFSSMPAV